MQMIEQGLGTMPDINMGGSDGVTLSMAQSVNLGNASHYDNDASIGIAVWTEIKPNETKGWFFIFPNLQIMNSGKVYHGLLIPQLYQGREICCY